MEHIPEAIVDAVEQIAYLNPGPDLVAAARARYLSAGRSLTELPAEQVEAEARAGLLATVVLLAELRRRAEKPAE